jgi:hypothetical protein
MTTNETEEQWHVDRLKMLVGKMATDLREAANRLEQAAAQPAGHTYVHMAGQVQRDALRGVGALDLTAMWETAVLADQARRAAK